MRSWPALLIAPVIALTDLSVLYAMVTPSCARQDRVEQEAYGSSSGLGNILISAVLWMRKQTRLLT